MTLGKANVGGFLVVVLQLVAQDDATGDEGEQGDERGDAPPVVAAPVAARTCCMVVVRAITAVAWAGLVVVRGIDRVTFAAAPVSPVRGIAAAAAAAARPPMPAP